MKQFAKKSWLIGKLIWSYVHFGFFGAFDHNYYAYIGNIYYELRLLKLAIKYFEKSEEDHGRKYVGVSKYNWCYMGYAHYNLGDYFNAAKYWEHYIALNPKDEQTLALLAHCREMLFEVEAALEIYSKLLQLSENNSSYSINYSCLLAANGNKEEALHYLNDFKNNVFNEPDRRFVESIILSVEEKYDEAVKILEELLRDKKIDYDNVDLFSRIALYLDLARLRKKMSNNSGALEALELGVAEFPGSIWLINELVNEYAERVLKLRKALFLINRAIGFQPNNPLFLDTKGWVLFKMDRPVKALKFLQRSLELNPNYKDARDHLETVTATLNQPTH